jgi:hypothetical protein
MCQEYVWFPTIFDCVVISLLCAVLVTIVYSYFNSECNCGGNEEDHSDTCPVKVKIVKVRK